VRIRPRSPQPGKRVERTLYGQALCVTFPAMSEAAVQSTQAADSTGIVAQLGGRSIVLVGMMGAGKSSVGRRLAAELGIPFVDADNEIEAAAGMTIPEIFDTHGEAYFRSGEARVIARLLDSGPQVLATGGGAFISPQTRALIRERGISVWLNADVEVLLRRIKRRSDRPLLRTDDPEHTLRRLVEVRSPIYAEADVTVHSRDVAHEAIVGDIIAALASRLRAP